MTVLKSRYVYEFDLKQFFPSVDIDEVTNILQEKGIPKGITYYLENINRNVPELPKDEKLDEKELKDRYKVHTSIKSGTLDPTTSMFDEIRKIGNPELIQQMMKEDGEDNIFE